MRRIRLPALLSAMVLLSGCATAVFERPCPRVSDFPPAVQAEAARELASMPPGAALPRMMDAMASDRAFNRRICSQ